MSLAGGKRGTKKTGTKKTGTKKRGTKKTGTKKRGNKSLMAWVTFVKRVAKEEKLPYRDAMMRAKVRKDKGEKWM
jgi:hypothetical protein